MGSFDVLLNDERTQLEAFVEEYRSAIENTLDGLTDEEARRRLVPTGRPARRPGRPWPTSRCTPS